jgi:hypothetical protein
MKRRATGQVRNHIIPNDFALTPAFQKIIDSINLRELYSIGRIVSSDMDFCCVLNGVQRFHAFGDPHNRNNVIRVVWYVENPDVG